MNTVRNLIRVHCKRFFFRWETFAVTLWNLLLTFLCIYFVVLLPEKMLHMSTIVLTAGVISAACTAAAVISIEISTLSTGAVRNMLIAGHTKGQIYLSKYLTVGVFGIVQGALFLIPAVLYGDWVETPVLFTATTLLVYAALACIAMTACLITDRPTVSVVVCIGCVFGLLFGGTAISSRLDKVRYNVESRYPLIVNENPWYIPAPQRDGLELFLRANPVYPYVEYCEWYFGGVKILYDTLNSPWASADANDNPLLVEYYQLIEDQNKSQLQRHTERLQLFPLYQTAFLVLFACCGMIIYRKRNLK